jgi:hypothetical protein
LLHCCYHRNCPKACRFSFAASIRRIRFTDAADGLIQQFRYNALGHRIRWQYDVNADSATDSSDPWYSFAYDEKWRIVATYRAGRPCRAGRFVVY